MSCAQKIIDVQAICNSQPIAPEQGWRQASRNMGASHVHSCMPGMEATAAGSHGIVSSHVRVHSQIPFPQREDVVAVAFHAVCRMALERVSDAGKWRDLQVRPCMCSDADWSHVQLQPLCKCFGSRSATHARGRLVHHCCVPGPNHLMDDVCHGWPQQ